MSYIWECGFQIEQGLYFRQISHMMASLKKSLASWIRSSPGWFYLFQFLFSMFLIRIFNLAHKVQWIYWSCQEIHNSHFMSLKDKVKYLELKILEDFRKILCDYKRKQSLTSDEILSRDQCIWELSINYRHIFVIGVFRHLHTILESK